MSRAFFLRKSNGTLANKILISGGAGILTITDKHMEEFNTLLCGFRDSGDDTALKRFLYDNTVQGIMQ